MLPPLVEEWDTALGSRDPLGFPGYAEALAAQSGESVRTGRCDGFVLIEGCFDVLGGSMGAVHGEKVVRAFDRAVALRLPVVVVTRSGGARMQEGMVSLVQLARTAAAIERHHLAGLLSVALMRSPTTGGVLASYGSLTDLRVAETGALIGFAGPRVVLETTGEQVGDRSHSAESAFAHGLVDQVAEPDDAVQWVLGALGLVDRPLRLAPLDLGPPPSHAGDPTHGDGGTAWAEVLAARDPGRPSGVHVAAAVTTSWTELGAGVDPALRTALATLQGRRVVVIACDRHGGSGKPTPAGLRLAQRAIHLAGRLGLPVVSLVDTPGAAAGADAENDGVAAEIARTFSALLEAPVPTLAVCVGEGGSGGALALACADRLLIAEHAIFSVIGPEGAAAILHHDAGAAPDVAEVLGLTSAELVKLGIVDAVVPDDTAALVAAVRQAVSEFADHGPGAERLSRWDEVTTRWIDGP